MITRLHTIIFFTIVSLFLPATIFAQVLPPLFVPGQTTDPTCAPGDVVGGLSCTVYPMSIGAGVAFGTAGSIPFIDAAGVLQQDNANLKWDELNKRLTLSQGLVLGSVNVVDTANLGFNAQEPVISGNYAYVVNMAAEELSIIDISNPPTASVVTTVAAGVSPGQPVISGNYAYVSSGTSSVYVIDISNPPTASVVTTVAVGSGPLQPSISGNYVYVTNTGSNNLSVIDITDVANVLPPSSVVALSVDGTIQSTVLSGSGVVSLTADNNGNIIPTFSDQSLKTKALDYQNLC
jgi:hypothetical protein